MVSIHADDPDSSPRLGEIILYIYPCKEVSLNCQMIFCDKYKNHSLFLIISTTSTKIIFLAYECGNVLAYKMLNSVLMGMGATLGNIARGYHSPHKITFGLKT